MNAADASDARKAEVTPPQQGSSAVSTRRMLRLSASALVVLAAEPTFVLVDTAVVGHLGPVDLGGLGIGGMLMSLVVMIGGFLEYGTTGRAARWFGAGDRARAVDEGVTATVLAIAVGTVAVLIGELGAAPLLSLLTGGRPGVYAAAETWFRVAVLGVPGILVVLAGNGWMRGVQDTRRPVVIVVAANVISAIASPILVYPLGLGLAGSAIANVAAQAIGGVCFLRAVQVEGRPWRPQWPTVRAQLIVGRDLLARDAAFEASFLVASGVAARMGVAQVAAHQIGLQLWAFTALVLDSFAIAAQSLVGAALGGGDIRSARRTARQVAKYGLGAGSAMAVLLGAGWWLIPAAFTPSAHVRHQAHLLWPFLVAMQPVGGVLFALDGVLIGAGDVGFMRTITVVSALGTFVPITLAALHWHWGIVGIWAGLAAFILTRLLGMIARVSGDRWLVTTDVPT